MPSFLLRRWRLIALCSGLAAVEAALLEGLAPWSTGLAPQVTAPAPFGVFHDLRWLVVYHRSVPAFVVEFVALLLFRTTLDALLVRAAWPDHLPQPGFGRAWFRTMLFTFVAAVLLAPWVVLLFGLAVVSLSWLFFSAIPPVLAVAILTHGGAVSGDWWRRTIPLRAVGWMVATFFVMSLSGVVVAQNRSYLAVPAAALSGLFNAWAWNGVVGAMTSERRSRRFAPVAPAGIAFLLAVVVGGTEIGFTVTTARAHDQRVAEQSAEVADNRPTQGPPVLIAAGFGTKWDGHSGPWLPGPFDDVRFSYRGLGPDGQPRAYESSDTTGSLTSLDAEMAQQVNALAAATHQPVSIVAASEASLVTETYLARTPNAPVSQVVLLSPLVAPGRVYYPPSGTDSWGVVGGLGLQALAGALGGLSPLQVSPSTPLFRSIEQDAPLIRSLLTCPPPGVHQVAVEPVADAVAAPSVSDPLLTTVVVPAFHSGSLGDPQVETVVDDILQKKPLPANGGWAFVQRVVSHAADVWQVPTLALTLNPAWTVQGASNVRADDSLSCAAARATAGANP